jgi:hypothetical protein
VDSSWVTYLLGPAGAAGLCLLFIMTGFLVPRNYHKRILDENEKLRQANDALAEANALLRDTNKDLAASGQLTNQVFTALLGIATAKQDSQPRTGKTRS